MRAASNVLLRDVNIVADHRGDVSRHERHLRRLHRLRRAGPPLRPRAGRVVRGARRRRQRDRDAHEGRRGRAAALQVRRPVRPRPEPGRHLQAALRSEPGRRRARPDGRARDRRPDEDAGRGLDVRQCVPVRDHPQQGRRADRRPRGAGQQDDRRRRRPRRARTAAAGRRVDDRRGRLRQPRARLLHRPRPSPDGRGAGRAAIRSCGDARRAPRRGAS